MRRTVVVTMLVAGALLLWGPPTGAQTYPPPTPPVVTVAPTSIVAPAVQPRGPQVLGASTTRRPSGLPVTGGDLLALAGVGAAAVVVGAVLARSRRRTG